jgi:A/G-specific adenine glycosylase
LLAWIDVNSDLMAQSHKSSAAGQNPKPAFTERTSGFSTRLLTWYVQHARDLPWRENRDPYRVWLSEIMLQQTRVAAVTTHYGLFLKKFPTVQKLARAREASVLAAWSGLGYYRRARMLHAAAKLVVKGHEGTFPKTSKELLSLPGIGRYTAAAIASIAHGEKVAVVDGNVERVLSRLQGRRMPGAEAWQAAQGLLDETRPGDFNQAMMELGATVCLPRQPRCLLCPVSKFCKTQGELPANKKASSQRRREIHYGLACRNGHIFLVQRKNEESLMPGMWELPEVCGNGATPLLSLRHSITVTDYTVRVVEKQIAEEAQGKWVALSRLGSLPLTGLARKILRRAQML